MSIKYKTVDFKVEAIKKLEPDNERVALVKMDIPRYGMKYYDSFYLDIAQRPKLYSFFASIGAKVNHGLIKMDWNNIVGKTGHCIINKFGIIEAYV